jgi:hypothetical protein
MSIYVLSLRDWEDYEPHWFECDCSKGVFDKAVEWALECAVEQLSHSEYYIDGGDILKIAVEELQERNNFKLITPDHEVFIQNLYLNEDFEDRNDAFSESAWDKMIKHNEDITKKNMTTKESGGVCF